MEDLLEGLKLCFTDSHRCIALTGSGGKTTCMIELAKSYAQRDMRVLLSTTTKLQLPKKRDYGCDTYFLDDRALTHHPAKGERVFYSHVMHKSVAPPLESLHSLLDRYDVLLLEADGAANLGLKLHEERDPVVPAFVTATLALVSFGLLGEDFGQNCYGSALYQKDFPEKLVTLDTYRKLLIHPQGIQKGMQGQGLVLCNQSREANIPDAREISSLGSPTRPIWFGDLRTNQLIYRNPS